MKRRITPERNNPCPNCTCLKCRTKRLKEKSSIPPLIISLSGNKKKNLKKAKEKSSKPPRKVSRSENKKKNSKKVKEN